MRIKSTEMTKDGLKMKRSQDLEKGNCEVENLIIQLILKVYFKWSERFLQEKSYIAEKKD